MKKVALLLVCFSLIFLSCSSKGQKKFGADADYFSGLKLKTAGEEQKARKLFNRCVKKGSFYVAQKSARELTTFGTNQEKNLASINLVQQFEDETSILIAANQLFSNGEFSTVIKITDKIDLLKTQNELAALRLKAMWRTGNPEFEKNVYEWFTGRTLSNVHKAFYEDFYVHPDFDNLNFSDETAKPAPNQFVLYYRIKAFKRDYKFCYENSPIIFSYLENHQIEPFAQLISDLGKAYLYGEGDFVYKAIEFKGFASEYAGSDVEYFFWFYAARFYQKAGNYFNQTKYCFLKAIETAINAEQKDNAIWYFLDISLKNSVASVPEILSIYAKQWSNAEYFDDFFDALIMALLNSGRWNDFEKILAVADGYASDESTAQLAYIYGRLLQEGYAKCDSGEKDACVKSAFNRALKSGTSTYYRILAAYRLGLEGAELQEMLCKGNFSSGKNAETVKSVKSQDEVEKIKSAENLLLGYAYFGFPELIYENYMEVYKLGLSTESSIYLAEYLKNQAEKNHDFFTQSLRITSRAVVYADEDFSKEQLKYFYPDNFLDYIKEASAKYKIDESVMLALIRSESFFAPEVISSAGAVGLCQLMESTAADVAKKLKISDFKLTDPKTNIEFGTYYLAELYRRCDYSYLQAFLSYNAGISRVRRWLKTSLSEFGAKKDMPADLFLETVPYAETRGYGRKLISATAMYDWLYSNDDELFYKRIGELLE